MVVSDMDPAVLSDQALSLLPPELATQLLLTRYVWAGTLAVRLVHVVVFHHFLICL
jgi:hypothetical protein